MKSVARSRKRVGLLGAGYIASYHAKALACLGGVEIVAVCDRALGRARACATAFGIPHAFSSLKEMLAASKLDAVHVLLPPDLHFEAAMEALEAGVHTFIEKPMCIDVEDCSRLIEKAKHRGLRVAVGHNFLFSEPYGRLRHDLQNGIFGPLDAVTVNWGKELGQLSAGPFDAWMLRRPENILLEVGPHAAAHLLDLIGQPTSIRVGAGNPLELPTGTRFLRRWQIGVDCGRSIGTLHLSFGRGFTEHTLHVRGHLAAATVDFERNTYLLHRHHPLEIDFDRLAMTRSEVRQASAQAWSTITDYVLAKAKLAAKVGNPYGTSISLAAKAFYESLDGGALDHRISPELGREVVALCQQIGQKAASTAHVSKPRATAATERRSSILVLGATGFIGRELLRQLLAEGRNVRAIVRSASRLPEDLRGDTLELVEGNLEDSSTLDRSLDGIEYVCHLARSQAKTWTEYEKHEIGMTKLIADRCLAARVKRFVYTGTIDSYYAGAEAGRITEETPLDPKIASRNLYARAKAASERILIGMHQEHGLPLIIVRPGIVIGRGGSPFHWGVGMWRYDSICQLWGQGRNPLPLVLVEDVANGIIRAMDAPGVEGESFNLVADPCLTAHEYLDELDRAGGMKVQRWETPIVQYYAADVVKWLAKVLVRFPERRPPSYRDWESRTQKALFDCSKAKSRLAWRPESDRAELIRRGIEVPLAEILR